jgi:hypothetical protein
MEDPHHFLLFDSKHGARPDRARSRHPHTLTCQASLAKKVARVQKADDSFFSPVG